jgi:hypothetical protein
MSMSNPQKDRSIGVILSSSDRTSLDEVVAHAPPGAELAASSSLVPHLADRDRITRFPTPILCSTEPLHVA